MVSHRKIGVYPSLACADYLHLAENISILDEFGVASYHIDIMDGNFVPNYCLNFDYLKAVKSVTTTECDVHLMTTHIERDIETSIDAGADSVSFHVERDDFDIKNLIQRIKAHGRNAGLVLNPESPLDKLYPYLEDIDYVILMSVRPGFAGQRFLDKTYDKISKLSELRNDKALGFSILVDGGINFENAMRCVSLGADNLVAGALCIFLDKKNIRNNTERFLSSISDMTTA